MKIASLLLAGALLVGQAHKALAQPAAPTPPPGSCGPVNGMSFVCGFKNPEDIVKIPGSRWLIASGMSPGGGLHLIDTAAKTQKVFYTEKTQARPDKSIYPNCAAPPDPATFNAHGIALRPTTTPGVYKLLAVRHEIETVEVFTMDARGSEPDLAWIGCVPMPAGMKGNAITAFSDGTILVTVTVGVGQSKVSMFDGGITGAVFSWTPGENGFHELAGTELSGNNGIEASPDEKEFYVAGSGDQTVTVFSRADTTRPLRQVKSPFFNLDNLRWTDGHLIAAGMMYDEPACGGTRKQIFDRGGNPNACIRGFAAGELDPATMEWLIVGYGEPNPVFGGIATAVVVGDTLWLSSYSTDRVAYRPLPGAQ